MGKRLLANYTFKGKIDGKSIKDYQNKIDLSVKTSQEIIDQVNEILNIEEINGAIRTIADTFKMGFSLMVIYFGKLFGTKEFVKQI